MEKLLNSSSQKWLLTGGSGLLGQSMIGVLVSAGAQVTSIEYTHQTMVQGVDRVKLDIRERDEVFRVIESKKPDFIVHAAALTDVDLCERHPLIANQLHVDASETLAMAAANVGAKLIYVSSDQLWDGSKPYMKEDDPVSPLNVYGRTKFEGEQIVAGTDPSALILRTNFYGPGLPWRKSFSDWIISALLDGRQLNMFEDVFFTPINVHHFIGIVMELVKRRGAGVFNVSGSERLSKYAFAGLLADLHGLSRANIQAGSVADAHLKAIRPHDMSLDTSKITEFLGHAMPDVRAGLEGLLLSSPSVSMIK